MRDNNTIATVSSAATLRNNGWISCLPDPACFRGERAAALLAAAWGGGREVGGLGQRQRSSGARGRGTGPRDSVNCRRHPSLWLLSQCVIAAVLAGFLSRSAQEGAGSTLASPRRALGAANVFGSPRVSWDGLRHIGWMPASIGGEEVELLNDSHYEKIRNMCGVKLADLAPDLFSFSRLIKGGGKGGDPSRLCLSCSIPCEA